MKCDQCSRPATVHLTEIRGGKKFEKNLCEQCAAKLGSAQGMGHTPINELLSKFVLEHSGVQAEPPAACEHCGITWAEFRQTGLLGCAADYDLFERDLAPLIQRAHEGATHHLGKTPGSTVETGAIQRRHVDLAKMKKELRRAVEAEDYERAAALRDEIRDVEQQGAV